MEDLSELLRTGDLFSVEEGGLASGSFVVSYDDVVAHEHEDLVERSGEALDGLAGVESVVHEDREQLVVRAPSLSAAELRRLLQRWWRDAVEAPAAWNEDLDAVAAAVGRAVAPHAFRKRKTLFYRETEPGLVQVIELERHRDDATGEQRVDVSPGVWLDEVNRLRGGHERPRRVSEVACHVRLRGGPLLDHPQLGWPLAAAGAEEVAGFAVAQVVPVLDRLGSRAGLLAEWEARTGRIGMGGEEVARAAVLVATGDSDRAGSVLGELFERSRPVQRPRLHDLTRALGLPPLSTGSRPDRSQVEDRFIEQWSSEPEQRRLDRVRAVVGTLGGPAPRLDGSVRSLGPLWEWMLHAVPHLQEAVPGGPLPALANLCSGVQDLSDANRLLAENVAVYLGVVLRHRFPDARWDLGDAGLGVELVVSGVPGGVAPVVDRARSEVVRLVAHPNRPRGLLHRHNPLRDLLARWSAAGGR